MPVETGEERGSGQRRGLEATTRIELSVAEWGC